MSQAVTISQIEQQLRLLPPDKLVVVFDFVSYLAERQIASESHQATPASEDEESEWLRAAVINSAFDFLKEPEEDIYTLADGKPFHRISRAAASG